MSKAKVELDEAEKGAYEEFIKFIEGLPYANASIALLKTDNGWAIITKVVREGDDFVMYPMAKLLSRADLDGLTLEGDPLIQ